MTDQTTPPDPAREDFEAYARKQSWRMDRDEDGNYVGAFAWEHWRTWQAQSAQHRAALAEIARVLGTAPDLNLKDYSKAQVEKLMRAMQYVYALVGNEPPSLRGDERATVVQCNSETEKRCTQPFHWEDGVPYCDTCEYFRASVAHEDAVRERAALAQPQPGERS